MDTKYLGAQTCSLLLNVVYDGFLTPAEFSSCSSKMLITSLFLRPDAIDDLVDVCDNGIRAESDLLHQLQHSFWSSS